MTEFRYYTFKAESGLQVTCLRGEEPPTITDGYGGWTVNDRPRRIGYPFWPGVNPLKMKVPCLFDGWAKGVNVEDGIGTLARMGQPVGGTGSQPPILNVIGAVPRPDIDRWVVESMEWGSNVIWGFGPSGATKRFRQDVIVNLIQYIAATPLRHRSKLPSGRPHPKHKFHRVKRGETLSKISSIEYGAAKWWRDIAKANKIRDPHKLKIGRNLRMP